MFVPARRTCEETVSATMKPVVVTATKTEHSLGETTADVSVVTREQIEKMPANNVLDVMRTMPGVPSIRHVPFMVRARRIR